jgi:hypothetical protein
LRRKNLIALLSSISLILILLVTGCTQTVAPQVTTPPPTQQPTVATVTSTPTPQIVIQDKTYNCLNPQGTQPPVDIKPLAKRLDTLDNKVIWVNQAEADPIIMPALNARLKKEYTKTDWRWIGVSNLGSDTPEADVLANAKAIIKGNAW